MSKPKSGKNYVSKGQRPCVSKKVRNAMRQDRFDVPGKWIELKNQWAKGRNPWLTVSNPNKGDTRARLIKVRANDHWGDPKKKNQRHVMKSMFVGGVE